MVPRVFESWVPPLLTERAPLTVRAEVVLLSGTATPKLIEALAQADERPRTKDESLTGHDSSFVHRPSIVGPLNDFAEAIELARGLAAPGDVVILSPGCASFGMFRNEFHRGEEFRRIVQQL